MGRLSKFCRQNRYISSCKLRLRKNEDCFTFACQTDIEFWIEVILLLRIREFIFIKICFQELLLSMYFPTSEYVNLKKINTEKRINSKGVSFHYRIEYVYNLLGNCAQIVGGLNQQYAGNSHIWHLVGNLDWHREISIETTYYFNIVMLLTLQCWSEAWYTNEWGDKQTTCDCEMLNIRMLAMVDIQSRTFYCSHVGVSPSHMNSCQK